MTTVAETLVMITRLSVVIFVVSSMLAMGMSQRLSDVIAPLKDWRTTLTTLGVSFVVAPLFALILVRVMPLEPAHATGLLLLAGAAGAPFLPKLAETSGGNVAQSVALMVLLMVSTIIFVPLVMPLIVPGLQADVIGIAGPLVVLMLVPLGIGFSLAQLGASKIERLLALVKKVSNIFFLAFLLSLTILQFKAMLQIIGSFAIGTYLIFVLGLFGVAYLVMPQGQGGRHLFGFAAAQRNISAALVVSGASFSDPAITTMVLLSAVVGLLVLMAMATAFGRNQGKPVAPE